MSRDLNTRQLYATHYEPSIVADIRRPDIARVRFNGLGMCAEMRVFRSAVLYKKRRFLVHNGIAIISRVVSSSMSAHMLNVYLLRHILEKLSRWKYPTRARRLRRSKIRTALKNNVNGFDYFGRNLRCVNFSARGKFCLRVEVPLDANRASDLRRGGRINQRENASRDNG